jgi:hypothetical protein
VPSQFKRSLFASGLRDGGISRIRMNSDSLLKLAMNERQVFTQCLRKTPCFPLKKSLGAHEERIIDLGVPLFT